MKNIDTTPVDANDKRLILGKTDVLQLFPLKYPWAWDRFLESQKNHWTPLDIAMGPDIADYNNPELPVAWKHRFDVVLAQLTTFDIMRGMDLAEVLMNLVSAPEIKMALMRQAEEESRHSWSYQYCIENMQIDESYIYNMYRTVPELNDRIIYTQKITDDLSQLTKDDLKTRSGKIEFLLSLCFGYLVFEGLWFALNLAGPIQSIARQKHFMATAEQFQYILRDEFVHINFGVDFINAFIREYPEVWVIPTIDKIKEMMHECVELERAFITYACKYQAIDYNINNHMEMVFWYVNRRMHSIGIQEKLYPKAYCSMPWISEMIETKKEKNFFETRVTEYQQGSLDRENIKGSLNLDDLDSVM